MIIGFDVETTGLGDDRKPHTWPGQPHIVQLACMLINDTGETVQRVSLIVRPDGWTIPEQASNIHGITQALAKAVGIPLRTVLSVFTNMRAVAAEAFAHNLEFDRRVVDANLHKCGIPLDKAQPWPPRMTCTKRDAERYVNLPPTQKMIRAGFDKPKAPTLYELHMFLFNQGFEGAHDALADVEATARCIVEMKRRARLFPDEPLLEAFR